MIELVGKMKRGSYIVNTARGRICDRDAIVRALESGRLAGYAGDVCVPQPPPPDHPWRTIAAPRHDAACVGNHRIGPGPLRRRGPQEPRVPGSPAVRSARNI